MDETSPNLNRSDGMDVIGRTRESVASGMKSAVRTLKETGAEAARVLQISAAEVEQALEQTAATVSVEGNAAVNAVAKISGRATRYVRSHDSDEMIEDLRRVARRYPTQAMAVALVAGFVMGRSFFRR